MRRIESYMMRFATCLALLFAYTTKANNSIDDKGKRSALEHLKAKESRRHAELIKLQESNPDAFEREIAKLVAAQPDLSKDAEAKGKGMRGIQEALANMKEQNPKRFEELCKLKDTSPERFAEEMKDVLKSAPTGIELELKELDQKERQLSNQINKSKEKEEREKLKKELAELLGKSFDLQQKRQQQRIDKMETQLKQMKEQLGSRHKQKKGICETRLKALLSPQTKPPADAQEPTKEKTQSKEKKTEDKDRHQSSTAPEPGVSVADSKPAE